MKKNITYIATLLALGACSEMDMQGHDPKDYYAEHPVETRAEMQYTTHTLHFAPGATHLAPGSVDMLRAQWADISPLAAESIQVQVNPSQFINRARLLHISKVLRNMGFAPQIVLYEPSEMVAPDTVKLDLTYAVAMMPRCPDWRASSLTTYSNAPHTNFGCATAVNLGLQVADPRDLERGTGGGTPDSERNAGVIRAYRQGSAAAASTETGGTAAGGAETAEPAQ